MTTSRHAFLLPGLAVLALATAPLFNPPAGAAPPSSIRVQGSLSDLTGGGGPVPANGTFAMTFRLFDALAGGALVASAGPTQVSVSGGLYNADVPFPPSAFGGAALFLEVSINGETLAPRIPIVSVPFAYQAGQASAVAPGAVVSASLAPGAVDSAGLAPGSVTADKLGIPCGEGQVLIRSGSAWICSTPPIQVICSPGDYISCYSGPASTAGVGPCRPGMRECVAGGTGFGPCVGMVTPAQEVCDQVDNDCNGALNNNCNVCGDGDVETNETCDDGNLGPGDGCDAACQVEPFYTCTGEPSVCGVFCGTDLANCNGVNADGCECQTSTCCGATCASEHENGLGYSYENCNPLGVPGDPQTYTLMMAIQARAAWPVTGTDLTMANYCGTGHSAVLRQNSSVCAVWVYTGPIAGYMRYTASLGNCQCPAASPLEATWN